MTPAQQNFELLWQASLKVLEDYYMTADPLRGGMQDRRAMIIRSAPEVGQQWFEFWRRDAATSYDLTESSLQTIFRQVTIKFTETAPGQYAAAVEASTVRSEKPYRWQPHSAARMYNMFAITGEERGAHGLLLNQPLEDPAAMMVPLGRDRELEKKIAMDLVKAKAKIQRQQAK